jgi:hypothetical protein
MKLSEYIEGLQEFLEENEDMEVYYARDDEGNGYQRVGYTGTKMFILASEETTSIKGIYNPDLYYEEDTEEYEDVDDFIQVCVIN